MKLVFIGLLVLIGLLDFALAVMCIHMEDQEQYKHMKGADDE